MFKTAFAALMAATAMAGAGTDYKTNGANWGTTDPLCASGKEQSPIDLSVAGASRSENMMLNGYGYTDFNPEQSDVLRNAGSVKVDVPNGEFHLNFADGSKSIFKILQFHFHAPSEHTVDGKNYDLEVHLVHLYAENDGLGGVIGIFFDRTAGNYNNDFLDAFWDTDSERASINLASFLRNVDFSQYWNYPGSLTTPPCTEGVKWTVIKDVQPISEEQLKKFTELWADDDAFAAGKGNNRMVMPLNDRTLYYNGALSGISAAVLSIAAAATLAF